MLNVPYAREAVTNAANLLRIYAEMLDDPEIDAQKLLPIANNLSQISSGMFAIAMNEARETEKKTV